MNKLFPFLFMIFPIIQLYSQSEQMQPFFDYYINSSKKIVYLAESATRYIGTNETGSQRQTQATVAITGVDTSNEIFRFAGDVAYQFTNISQFDISGSTGNDGTYTISSVSYGPLH